MKKIVSAVALASVAFGAFAVDVTIKSEIKYKPTIAQFDSTEDFNDKSYMTQGAGLTNDATTIQLTEGPVTVYGKYDFKDSGLSMNTAYGKLTWGNFNITAGYFESRFSDRVTTDQNDLSLIEQNHAVKYLTQAQNSAKAYTNRKQVAVVGNKKLGINPNAGMPIKAGQDADNVTTYQGSKLNSFVIDYTFKDLGPGSLLLKAVAKTNAGAWVSANDDYTSTTTNNSGYSFEAAYTHEAFKGDFVANLDADNIGSWGLYVSPTAVDGLKATLGFTYAWASKATVSSSDSYKTVTGDGVTISDGYYYDMTDTAVTKNDVLSEGTLYYYYKPGSSTVYDVNAWAIDARARYAINDALAAGVYANVTSLTKYEKNGTKQIDGANTALDVVLNVNYKLNDLAKFFVEGEYAAKSISNKEKKGDQASAVGSKYGTTALVFQGGAILTPAKGATITGAVRCIMGGFGADSDNKYSKGTTVVIPISFKTSL